jgi:2-hydroxy-6-oxonona-2,4-dienedioate hydrolase
MRRTSSIFGILSIIVVTVGGLISLSYQNDITRAHTVAERGGRIMDTAGGPIEYADIGSGMVILSIRGVGGWL